MAGDERAQRVGRNESLFREVNERAAELADRLDTGFDFVCECSRLDCVEHLRVPVAVYERTRANERWFVVTDGHEQPEFERVIEQGPGWLIVEKTGEAGRVAAANDPRSDT